MTQNVFVLVVRYNGIVGVFSEEVLAENYMKANQAATREEYLIEEYEIDFLVEGC